MKVDADPVQQCALHAPFPVLGTAPGPRYGHTAIVTNVQDGDLSGEMIVMFGGATTFQRGLSTKEDGTAAAQPLSHPGACCELHVMHVHSGEWSRPMTVGDPHPPRIFHAAARLGKMVVIQGGIGPEGLCLHDLHAVDLTDPGHPQWCRLAAQGTGPGPRYGHTMTHVAGRFLVVFGGCDGMTPLGDVWALDTTQEPFRWEQIVAEGEGSPSARMFAAAAPSPNGAMFLCGGRDVHGDPLADAHWLFFRDDGRWEWKAEERMMPVARYQHTVVCVGSAMHIFGGQFGADLVEPHPSALIFDPTESTWTAPTRHGTTDNSTCRHQHVAVALGPYVFLHGGVRGSEVLDDLLLCCSDDAQLSRPYNPASLAWCQWLDCVKGRDLGAGRVISVAEGARGEMAAVDDDGQLDASSHPAAVIASAAKLLLKQAPLHAGLDDEQLLQRIATYRKHISGVMEVIDKLEEDRAAVEGGQAPVAGDPVVGDEFAALGKEGVDFTYGNIEDVDEEEWQVPPHCVPIHANVTTFDWRQLHEYTQFDVVMMDPPWQLATANPTRGVSLGYSQLADYEIESLPIPKLQRNGYLFVWLINNKYKFTLDLFEKWGYSLVDEIVWVKMTVNRRMAKSHGYYLQHAKEVCLVGRKGDTSKFETGKLVGSDVIFSERRGQSQKPEEVYGLIEQLVPSGRYLEIFARKNNLRNYWVSIGNEVTGTGLPEESLAELK